MTTVELLNLASKIVEFRRLAMLLLAECPQNGEYAARPVKALDQVFANGSGVVRYEILGEPDSYVVLRPDGTRYTSTQPPADLNEKDFFVERPFTYRGSYVWEKLRKVISELQIYGSTVNDRHGIEVTAHFVESLKNQEITGILVSQQIIAEVIYLYPEVTESRQIALRCSNDCLDKIFQAFRKLQLNGDVAKQEVATFTFFCEHPSPEKLFQVVNSSTAITSFLPITMAGSTNIQRIPINQVEYYLTHPVTFGVDTFIAAIQAAKKLRQHGKSLTREAISCSGVVSFHEHLYTALLSYRAAQTIYEAFMKLNQTIPNLSQLSGLDGNELHRFWVETEEARVSILSSIVFAAVASHRGPNISAPTEFFSYWQMALDGLGKDKTRIGIQDMVIRWVCPEFLRDLAISWLALQSAEFSERLVRRLTSICETLEKDLLKNALQGEPNYLTICYSTLANFYRSNGNLQRLQQFEEKADARYFMCKLHESSSSHLAQEKGE